MHATSFRRTSAMATALALLAAGAQAKPRRAPHEVTGAVPASECGDCVIRRVDVAGGPAGTFLAAWTIDGPRVLRQLFDADGAGGGDTGVGNSGQVLLSGIAGFADGWLLGWYQPGQLWAQRLDLDGSAAAPVRVNESGPGDDHGTGLVAAGDGAFLVWNRGVVGDPLAQVVVRRLSGDGSPAGDEQMVAETVGRTVADVCAFPNGRGVVVWTSFAGPRVGDNQAPTGVSLRRIDVDGTPIGPEQVVAAPVLDSFTTAPTVACKPDNSFLVAWNSNVAPAKKGFDTLYLAFDANGNPRGKAAVLSTITAGDQFEPALLAQPDGTVLAAWNSTASGGSVLTGRWLEASRARLDVFAY